MSNPQHEWLYEISVSPDYKLVVRCKITGVTDNKIFYMTPEKKSSTPSVFSRTRNTEIAWLDKVHDGIGRYSLRILTLDSTNIDKYLEQLKDMSIRIINADHRYLDEQKRKLSERPTQHVDFS